MAKLNMKLPAKSAAGMQKPGLKKTGLKIAGKKATAAKTPAEPKKFEANTVVEFVGYANKESEKLFEPGSKIVIVQVEDNPETGQLLTCISDEQYGLFVENPESDDIKAQEILPAEVKRLKGFQSKPKVPEKPIVIKDVGSMIALMKKKPDLLEAAVGLYENIQQTFFTLGGVLAHLYYEKKYQQYEEYADPKTGWDTLCQERFGFKGRKGVYLADIYKNFSVIDGFDPKRLESVGWSKSAEVARFVTAENVDELLELADTTPIIELKETLRTTAGEGGDNKTATGRQVSRGSRKIKQTAYNFRLFEDQAEGVNLILETAKKQLGLSDLSQVFEHIVTEWGGDHLAATVVQKAQRAVKAKRTALQNAGVKMPDDQKAAA